MELTSLQIAVARLSTDAGLRARFAANPAAAAASLGLSCADADSLAKLNVTCLDRFAATLIRKELKHIRHELPRLSNVLGERLRILLAEFQRPAPWANHQKGGGSARAFAAFVARRTELDTLTRDVARLEGRLARVRRSWLPVGVCRVHHRLDESDELTRDALARAGRLQIAFIIRMTGRIRIWYFPLRLRRGVRPTTCVAGSETIH